MFRRKNKIDVRVPNECKIKMFDKTYSIKILIEGDVTDDDCLNIYKHFISINEQIESKIKEYVESNYFELIKDYYIDVTFANFPFSKERKEHSQFVRDYETKEKKSIENVIKNIEPIYFSILDGGKSALFFLFNSADSHGFDVVITSSLDIIPHDELE